MKILFTFPRDFGCYPHIYEYCTILKKNGIECVYVGIDEGVYKNDETPDRVPVVYVDRSAGDFSMFRRFARQIDEIKPDIVHCFFFRGCGILPYLSRNRSARWIIDIRSVQLGGEDGRSWMLALKNMLLWFEANSYDSILVLTNTLKEKYRNAVRHVTQIPLGANKARLVPADRDKIRSAVRDELDIPYSATVILYTGAVHPWRGLPVLINAFLKILHYHPGAYLIIVGGDQDRTIEEDLKVYVRQNGFGEKVKVTGYVPYFHVHRYYIAADIGISYVPIRSSYYTQPPTKLVEYMTAGLLSIATATEGSKPYIDDGENGFLCGDSEEDVADGLLRALSLFLDGNENLNRRREMIRKAQTTVEPFDWEKIVKQRLIPYYRSVLNLQ